MIKSIGKIRLTHLLILLLLMAVKPLIANERSVVWRKQSAGFNPTLCCATFYDGISEHYSQKLSELDKLITKVHKPLRDSIQFSVLEENEIEGDLILLKSNRDTCGLTYLLRKRPTVSVVLAVFNKPPDSVRANLLSWVFSIDLHGTQAKAYASLKNGEYHCCPKQFWPNLRTSESSPESQFLDGIWL